MVRSHILRRFELYLAAVTALSFTAVAAMAMGRAATYLTLGVAFALLLALQIAIQWADRERQRRLRARAIHDIREMLQDRLVNQITALRVWATMSAPSSALSEVFESVDESIEEVIALIDGLSEEQLDTWQLRYAQSDIHRYRPAAQPGDEPDAEPPPPRMAAPRPQPNDEPAPPPLSPMGASFR